MRHRQGWQLIGFEFQWRRIWLTSWLKWYWYHYGWLLPWALILVALGYLTWQVWGR